MAKKTSFYSWVSINTILTLKESTTQAFLPLQLTPLLKKSIKIPLPFFLDSYTTEMSGFTALNRDSS
jgi:hypothetical protein